MSKEFYWATKQDTERLRPLIAKMAIEAENNPRCIKIDLTSKPIKYYCPIDVSIEQLNILIFWINKLHQEKKL